MLKTAEAGQRGQGPFQHSPFLSMGQDYISGQPDVSGNDLQSSGVPSSSRGGRQCRPSRSVKGKLPRDKFEDPAIAGTSNLSRGSVATMRHPNQT